MISLQVANVEDMLDVFRLAERIGQLCPSGTNEWAVYDVTEDDRVITRRITTVKSIWEGVQLLKDRWSTKQQVAEDTCQEHGVFCCSECFDQTTTTTVEGC